jgi:hypothetical protein
VNFFNNWWSVWNIFFLIYGIVLYFVYKDVYQFFDWEIEYHNEYLYTVPTETRIIDNNPRYAISDRSPIVEKVHYVSAEKSYAIEENKIQFPNRKTGIHPCKRNIKQCHISEKILGRSSGSMLKHALQSEHHNSFHTSGATSVNSYFKLYQMKNYFVRTNLTLRKVTNIYISIAFIINLTLFFFTASRIHNNSEKLRKHAETCITIWTS